MRYKYLSCLVLLVLTLGFVYLNSCSDNIDNNESIEQQADSKGNVNDLIEYAKKQYYTNSVKATSEESQPQTEPQWSGYEVFKQEKDTLSISIPINDNSDNKKGGSYCKQSQLKE